MPFLPPLRTIYNKLGGWGTAWLLFCTGLYTEQLMALTFFCIDFWTPLYYEICGASVKADCTKYMAQLSADIYSSVSIYIYDLYGCLWVAYTRTHYTVPVHVGSKFLHRVLLQIYATAFFRDQTDSVLLKIRFFADRPQIKLVPWAKIILLIYFWYVH
jgi:hypothetical protein